MPLLVIVEDCFVARGRGVLVEPRFAPDAVRTGVFDVVLRLPDGSERTTTASMETSHMRGALVPWDGSCAAAAVAVALIVAC